MRISDWSSDVCSSDLPTVRYLRHSLEGAEVRKHIAEGKLAVRLGLRWNNRASFVLTDKFEVKKLRFEDIEKAREAVATHSPEEQFDDEFALMSGDLVALLAGLGKARGGPPMQQAAGSAIQR